MKTSPTRSKPATSKVTKAPTRVSSRIAAKNVALKMEKNTRQDNKHMAKRNCRAKFPVKSSKNEFDDEEFNQIKEDEDFRNKTYELNEDLRDNPCTSRNSQKTYSLSKEEFDSCKWQMHFEDLNIDFYPSAIRAIENSDNELAIRALHNIEKLHVYRHF